MPRGGARAAANGAAVMLSYTCYVACAPPRTRASHRVASPSPMSRDVAESVAMLICRVMRCAFARACIAASAEERQWEEGSSLRQSSAAQAAGSHRNSGDKYRHVPYRMRRGGASAAMCAPRAMRRRMRRAKCANRCVRALCGAYAAAYDMRHSSRERAALLMRTTVSSWRSAQMSAAAPSEHV